jgi:hypothetical protein
MKRSAEQTIHTKNLAPPFALFVGAGALLAAGGAAAFAWRRRRSQEQAAVQPPMPEALFTPADAPDQQIPEYYGGEQLGRTSGEQHYASPASKQKASEVPQR